MTPAIDLLDEVERAGGYLEARGDRLKVRAPKALPDDLVIALRQHRAEIINFLAAAPTVAPAATSADGKTPATWPDVHGDRPHQWDGETPGHIEWFLASAPPATPFELQRGVTIAHPHHYWAYLLDDIRNGPGGPRAHYGALQHDLRRLHKLFGPSRSRK